MTHPELAALLSVCAYGEWEQWQDCERLVLADWLEERGDERVEVVRGEGEVAQLLLPRWPAGAFPGVRFENVVWQGVTEQIYLGYVGEPSWGGLLSVSGESPASAGMWFAYGVEAEAFLDMRHVVSACMTVIGGRRLWANVDRNTFRSESRRRVLGLFPGAVIPHEHVVTFSEVMRLGERVALASAGFWDGAPVRKVERRGDAVYVQDVMAAEAVRSPWREWGAG